MIEQIICGDCLEKLKELPNNYVDSIITDPPYGLVSIQKRFGKEGSAPAQFGEDGSFGRLSRGFMGKTWDGSGIEYNVEMWSECLRVLKPGGHLLSFGGTRTYHRMASAIEDAGFEVRDMIEWVYGSGFPKSLNIGKAVDKLQGNEREDLGPRTDIHSHGANCRKNDVIYPTKEPRATKGTSEWEGWGTALKPAHEPICMARKPLEKGLTVAENCLKWGTGGINIDESRVETEDSLGRKNNVNPYGSGRTWSVSNTPPQDNTENPPTGRFPANLIHDNSEEVRECFPNTKSSGGQFKRNDYEERETSTNFTRGDYTGRNDSGSASRFFKSIIYTAKASKGERNMGCDELEEKEEVYPGINTFNESGDRLRADGSIIPPLKSKNNHPTVKPIALMEYLIKMVTPSGGIVLDPFAGSGSTLVAAKQNGYQFIGIEKEEEYVKIIEARVSAAKLKPLNLI